MLKHTSGRWEAYTNTAGVGVSHSDPSTGDIAHCSGLDSRRSPEEELGNARILAEALEMMVVLKGLVFNRRHGNGYSAHIEMWEQIDG
jgi:hypothetical protein